MLKDLHDLEVKTTELESDYTPSKENLPECVLGKNYFVTGSVAFGCQHRRSDVDICIPICVELDVKNVLKSNYNSGL